MNDQLTSNEFNLRLLRSSVPGKLYQTIYAYLSLGGWNPDKAVWLSYKFIQEYGLSRKTIYRHTAELQELGVFTYAGLTREGHRKYFIQIPDDLIGQPVPC